MRELPLTEAVSSQPTFDQLSYSEYCNTDSSLQHMVWVVHGVRFREYLLKLEADAPILLGKLILPTEPSRIAFVMRSSASFSVTACHCP